MLNRLLFGLVGGATVIAGAFLFGTMKGRDWCEARHERERLETQEQLDRQADETRERTRQLLLQRDFMQTQIESLENEIESIDGVCRADPGGVRRLNERWRQP